jgi:hypothetical protein
MGTGPASQVKGAAHCKRQQNLLYRWSVPRRVPLAGSTLRSPQCRFVSSLRCPALSKSVPSGRGDEVLHSAQYSDCFNRAEDLNAPHSGSVWLSGPRRLSTRSILEARYSALVLERRIGNSLPSSFPFRLNATWNHFSGSRAVQHCSPSETDRLALYVPK